MKNTTKTLNQSAMAFCGIAALFAMTTQKSQAGNAAYDAQVNTVDGAVVHYDMDTTTGTTAENSGSGGATYAGTFGSDVTLGASSEPNLNTSVKNNDPGTATGYTVSSSASPLGTGHFTAEAWFNAASTSGGQQFIFDFAALPNPPDSGYDAGLSVYINGSDVAAFDNGVGNNGLNFDSGSGAFTAGTWNLVDFVRSSGQISLYLNGNLIATSIGNAAYTQLDTVNLDTPYAVGANTDGTDGEFNGKLDEFALYTTGLTQTQIEATYALGSGPLVESAPEPSTWAMTFIGLGAFAIMARRRSLQNS